MNDCAVNGAGDAKNRADALEYHVHHGQAKNLMTIIRCSSILSIKLSKMPSHLYISVIMA